MESQEWNVRGNDHRSGNRVQCCSNGIRVGLIPHSTRTELLVHFITEDPRNGIKWLNSLAYNSIKVTEFRLNLD